MQSNSYVHSKHGVHQFLASSFKSNLDLWAPEEFYIMLGNGAISLFFCFSMEKEVPIYFSCLEECCNIVLPWSSRNVQNISLIINPLDKDWLLTQSEAKSADQAKQHQPPNML